MSRYLALSDALQGEGGRPLPLRRRLARFVAGVLIVGFAFSQVHAVRYVVPAWWKGTTEGLRAIFVEAPSNLVAFVRNGGRLPNDRRR